MERDLTRVDLWEDSLRRSRERRERIAAQPPFELPARRLSLTALVALAGVPATGVAAAAVLGDGGEEASARPEPKRVAVELQARGSVADAIDRAAGIDKPAAPAPRASKSVTTTAGSAPGEARPAASESASATPAASGGTSTTATASGSASAATAAARTRPVAARVSRSGGGVAELQRRLGLPADGDFGPRTQRALARWQRNHGLAGDGVAGPRTRRALGLGAGPVLKRERPARRRRSRDGRSATHGRRQLGGGVRGLQTALGVGADGVFGPGTERALKSWQRAHGLAADGVAGPQTRANLGLGPGPVLKRRGGGRRGSSTGGGSSTVQRVVAAANRIAGRPYKYGGGHGSFEDSGYDCSGSVSYALHGGGLLSTPLDSSAFMSYGAPGPGRHITIYANPGHVYMTIDGRRFDTSARSETGSRWTGSQRGSGGYVVRHPPGL